MSIDYDQAIERCVASMSGSSYRYLVATSYLGGHFEHVVRRCAGAASCAQKMMAYRETATLTAIAPLDAWDLEWHTSVACPTCGAHQRYELVGLADFHCADCGYDSTDSDPPISRGAPGGCGR